MKNRIYKRIATLLVFAMLTTGMFFSVGPVKTVKAGGADIKFASESDMNEKISFAKPVSAGEKVLLSEHADALLNATYPKKITYVQSTGSDTYDDYYDVAMESGEGYLFTFDVPANTVAVITPEGENVSYDDRRIEMLGYRTSPEAYEAFGFSSDTTWMRTSFSEQISDIRRFPMANYYSDSYTDTDYLFIPKSGSITAFTLDYYPLTGDQTIGGGKADRIEDFYDRALDVTAGVEFDFSLAEKITVTAEIETIWGWMDRVAVTKEVSGRFLHINVPEGESWYLLLSKKSPYHISQYLGNENQMYYNPTFDYQTESTSVWINSESYLFIPDGTEIVEWSGHTPYEPSDWDDPSYEPVNIGEKLQKDKVNIVSWDDDLEISLKNVYSVYPSLKEKINFINMGISSSEYAGSVLAPIAAGTYDGYTILAATDINAINQFGSFDSFSDLGFKQTDYANSYEFARELGTVGGELKAVAWYVCPNGFYYNAAIAKKVLGTDDPDAVQKMLSTPEKFNDVAKKMRDAGYYMTSGVDYLLDSENYYRANSPEKDMMNVLLDLLEVYKGNLYDTGTYMWGEEWFDDMKSGRVFGYFGTTWMKAVFGEEAKGMYKLCSGPVSYHWGGSFVVSKNLGTQGETAVQVLKALCCDEKVMKLDATLRSNFVNNKAVNRELISNGTLAGSWFVGSQDPTAVWHQSALALGNEKDIALKKISACTCTYTASRVYTGSLIKPVVTVKDGTKKLTLNKDYTVSYAKNKKVGTATIKITGKGNYTGTLTKTFKIIPKGTALKTATSTKKKTVNLTWTPQKTKMSTLNVTGYIIQYSSSKTFASGNKTLTVKGYKKGSTSIEKLASGKTYYVRIRTFTKIDGVNYLGKWSTAKTVKVK